MDGAAIDDVIITNREKWATLWINFCSCFLNLSFQEVISPEDKGINRNVYLEVISLFLKENWSFSLDAIEWLEQEKFGDPNEKNSENERIKFHSEIDSVLKNHNIGYAFIEGKFVPLSNEAEISAVRTALESPSERVRGHISKAIDSLDRNSPHYANCIKEGIFAIEGVLSDITGENEFGKACDWLKNQNAPLHPQFLQAIKNFYRFTSDVGGVRHSEKDDKKQEIDKDVAVCMLGACSAIANYLAAKAPQLKKDKA